MTYADLKSLDRLYNSLDDDAQTRRMDMTTPDDADWSDEWPDARTVLKFCSVPWDQHYSNVVGWKSDEQRDKWFDALDGDVVTLHTAWNYRSLEVYKPSLGKYEGSVRVPIPYETALGYNYLQVHAYDQPLPQYGDYQRSEFHYHITGINKLAGSTTELILELDAWTEYICSAHLDAVDLERGHWPMSQVDAAQWLKDPLSSPVRMSEPEPDLPEVKSKVMAEHFYPLYDDSPMVAVSMLADLTDPGALWTDGKEHDGKGWWSADDPGSGSYQDLGVTKDETFQPYPITTDVTQVGYQKGMADPNLAASPVVPSGGTAIVGHTVSPLHMYAVEPGDWPSFRRELQERLPQALQGVKAVYVMPSRYLNLGRSLVLGPVAFRVVTPNPAWDKLGSYGLDPDKWGYDKPWAGYAKMYSGQFSLLELSDMSGHTVTVGCEDLAGDLDVMARATSVWPFLSFEAFVDGIGGRGIKDYRVKPVDEATAQMPQGLWEQVRMTWDVPTYALYADNRTNAALTYASRRQSRDAANRRWQMARASATVSRSNGLNTVHAAYNDAIASAGASLASGNETNDTNWTNAHQSAETARANEGDSLATARTNTNNSAAATLANGNASAGTTQADASANADTDQTNGTQNFEYTHSSTQRGIDYDKAMKGIIQKYIMKEYSQESTWMNERNNTMHGYASASIPAGSGVSMLAHQIKTWKANHAVNNDQSRVNDPSMGSVPKQAQLEMAPGGTISDDAGFTVPGSTPGGDLGALATWTGQLVAQEALANLQISTRFNWSHQAIDFASSQAQGQYNETLAKTVDFNTSQNDLNRQNNESVLNRSIATRRANIARDYGTATGNNSRTYNTTVGNATRSYNTGITNADRTRGTAIGNADRSHATQAGVLARTNRLAQSAAAKERRVGEVGLDNEYRQKVFEADQARTIEMDTINAGLRASYASAPVQLTEASGDAALDQLGSRGVDVRIRRISKADEMQVGRTFQRWGYRMPSNTWIDNPKLTIRDRYTYWQCRDVWMTPSRMSETARSFLTDILKEGTTVWTSPDDMLTKGLE